MIPLNKPFLPPRKEYEKLLDMAWTSGSLTNNGPLVRRLEEELKELLQVKHLFLVSSCSAGLEIAVKSLNKTGEIITSPFSYVAAPAAIVAGKCRPVYSDIDPDTLGIDPGLIENRINPETIALLPTHLYGKTCDVKNILSISKKFRLPVIWDAAHSFGTNYNQKAVVSFPDISVLSFHSYKIFHTIEGGAVVTDNDEYAERIYELRYFGLSKKNEFVSWGMNAKMNEFQAAMGLANLPYLPEILESKKEISVHYHSRFAGSSLTIPSVLAECESNESYFPVLFQDEEVLLKTMVALDEKNIQSRRYFFPSLNTLGIPGNQLYSMPHSESAASRVLCLPCFFGMPKNQVDEVCDTILKTTGE